MWWTTSKNNKTTQRAQSKKCYKVQKQRRNKLGRIPTFEFFNIESDSWNNFALSLFLRLKMIEQGRFAGVVQAHDQDVTLFLLQTQHIDQLIEKAHYDLEWRKFISVFVLRLLCDFISKNDDRMHLSCFVYYIKYLSNSIRFNF